MQLLTDHMPWLQLLTGQQALQSNEAHVVCAQLLIAGLQRWFIGQYPLSKGLHMAQSRSVLLSRAQHPRDQISYGLILLASQLRG